MNRLDQRLASERLLIADGAMGTLVQQRAMAQGFSAPIDIDAVMLEYPEIVGSIHHAYVRAGASLVLTNTFTCSAYQLNKRGHADAFRELHKRAAQVARAAAGEEGLVLGDMGPIGAFFSPMGSLTLEEARQAYAERAEALVQTGCVDGLLVETQYDLREVESAIDGIRSVNTLPIVVSMTFDSHGHTMMGVSPEQFAQAMVNREIHLIGANCGSSIEETLDALRKIHAAAPHAMLWAKPNAGLPRLEDGVEIYDLAPKDFAEEAKRFAALGVKVFGGCCGTSPAHIARVTEALSPTLR